MPTITMPALVLKVASAGKSWMALHMCLTDTNAISELRKGNTANRGVIYFPKP